MRPLRHCEQLVETNPALRLLLSFVVGLLAGRLCQGVLPLSPVALFGGAFASGLCCLVALRCYERAAGCVAYLAFLNASIVLSGIAFFVSAERGLDAPWPQEEVAAVGIVTGTARPTLRTQRVDVAIRSGAAAGRRVRLSLSGGDTLAAGDVLWFRCRLSPPRGSGNPGTFDYAAYLRRQGVSGTGYCPVGSWRRASSAAADAVWRGLPPLLRLKVAALRFRDRLLRQYAGRLEGRALAVVSAMTLGDRTRIDDETRSLFAETGASHLLALSGLHLGILFALYRFFVLRRIARRRLYAVAALLGVAALWGFAFVAGLPVSLVRAAVMFSLWQLAACLNADRFPVNNLALAAWAILLCSPAALFDVGFQLSCLSVLSILLFNPLFPRPKGIMSRRPLRFGCELLSVSLSAQIGTLPVVAYVFHELPVYGLLANLLVVPLSYPLLAAAFLFLLVPPLRPATGFVLETTFGLMERLLGGLAALPGSTVEWRPALLSVVLCYVLLALVLACSVRRRTRWLWAAAGTLALMGGAELWARRPGHLSSRLVVYHLRGTSAVHFLASERQSCLWRPDSVPLPDPLDRVRRTYWQQEGILPPRPWPSSGRVPLLAFAGRRMAVWNGPLPAGVSRLRGQVDYLLVTRGARGSLHAALWRYAPRMVVLDGSLPDWRREKLRVAAVAEAVRLHDTAADGALVELLAP